MTLWILFALMTAVAALAIMRPFWRADAGSVEAPPRDIEVYRQQLQEIEEETARGVLGKAEANVARVEISRRILAAADANAQQAAPSRRAPAPFYVLAGLLPAVTLSLYLIYGSPNYAGQPLAARNPHEGQSVEALVARVEERLRLNPDDGAGWSVIAPVYMRMERFADAAQAYRHASRLLGETADLAANLGEALALANDGSIDDAARAALEKAVALDADHAKARFWLAVADEQAGRKPEAIAAFRQLLGRDLPDAVKGVINQRIAVLEGRPAPEAAQQQQQQPPAGVDAAQIDRMVSGLAERLKQDGSDLKGWLMLVRAYTVLGRKDDAVTALNQARGQFAGNNEALGQIDALAKSLGLPS
jgi:cytochrome c-type biogenesis protein CcmH